MHPFSFPIWVFINEVEEGEDGHPFYMMVRGGHDSGIPESLPIYSSEDNAKAVDEYGQYELVQMDRAAFYKALSRCRYVEDVVHDLGTPHAQVYRVESLIANFGSDDKL